MLEPVSALNRAAFDGLVRIEETGLQGMITLRGDLSDKAIRSAASAASGIRRVPDICQANVAGDKGLCWMSPDELLILCPYEAVAGALDKLQAALSGTHALAVNVSDARAVFCVAGPMAREVLAKLCPVDLAPTAFTQGMFRRTRMAQIPVAFWMDGDESFRIVCFRSVAKYAFDVLKVAAQPGSAVGMFARPEPV